MKDSDTKPGPKDEPASPGLVIDTSTEEPAEIDPEEQRLFEERKKCVRRQFESVDSPEFYQRYIERTRDRAIDALTEEQTDFDINNYKKLRSSLSDLSTKIALEHPDISSAEAYAGAMARIIERLFELNDSPLPDLMSISQIADLCNGQEQLESINQFIGDWAIATRDIDPGAAYRGLGRAIGSMRLNQLFRNYDGNRRDEIRSLIIDNFKWIEDLKSTGSLSDDVAKEVVAMVNEKVYTDSSQIGLLREFIEGISELSPDAQTEIIKKMRHYSAHHDIDRDTIIGFIENLAPRLEAHDDSVSVLQRVGNSWGMGKGDFGASDFVIRALTRRAEPEEIHFLQMIASEISTTDAGILNQIRLDALVLSQPFGALRDYIHDQRPCARLIVEAMIDFYHTGDNTKIEESLDEARKYDPNRFSSNYLDRFSQRSAYELELTVGDRGQMKAIDILEEILSLYDQKSKEPSPSGNGELDGMMKEIESEGGWTKKRNALVRVLKKINGMLRDAFESRQLGVEPGLIEAITYLDRVASQVLQDMSYETQYGAYESEWFSDIAQFYYLTHKTGDYNAREMDKFLVQIRKSGSDEAAYRTLSQFALDETVKLLDKYDKLNKSRYSGIIWSGNLNHEMIGILDPRQPETEIGRKHRLERMDGQEHY